MINPSFVAPVLLSVGVPTVLYNEKISERALARRAIAAEDNRQRQDGQRAKCSTVLCTYNGRRKGWDYMGRVDWLE